MNERKYITIEAGTNLRSMRLIRLKDHRGRHESEGIDVPTVALPLDRRHLLSYMEALYRQANVSRDLQGFGEHLQATLLGYRPNPSYEEKQRNFR